MILSDEEVRTFARDGYLVLRRIVPQSRIEDVTSLIDNAYSNGDHGYSRNNPKDVVPQFKDDVSKHSSIVNIMTDTELSRVIEQLIGRGCAEYPKRVQVALREPSEYWKSQGWDIHSSIDAIPWHIDGGEGPYASNGSPFTMLVGVCLSEGQQATEENHGQFLAWPRSHTILHPLVADRVRKGLITDPYSVFNDIERPNIGEPIRVALSPGDAVIAHQRLGHTGGPNLGPHVRKNLYFRVKHVRHDTYLKSGELIDGWVWAEYQGVREVLERLGPLI